MNNKASWGKERAEAFARPVPSKAGSIYAALARKITSALGNTGEEATLLDLGCGSGMLVVEIKRLLPQAGVIGVDPSEYMLNIARQNAETANFPEIEFLPGRAEQIPVDENAISLLISQWSLHDWENAEKGFSEITRVLKPNGMVIITDWDCGFPNWRFYLHNLGLMRRGGWKRAKEARNSYRNAYPFDHVLDLLLRHKLNPVVSETNKPVFFVRAIYSP